MFVKSFPGQLSFYYCFNFRRWSVIIWNIARSTLHRVWGKRVREMERRNILMTTREGYYHLSWTEIKLKVMQHKKGEETNPSSTSHSKTWIKCQQLIYEWDHRFHFKMNTTHLVLKCWFISVKVTSFLVKLLSRSPIRPLQMCPKTFWFKQGGDFRK